MTFASFQLAFLHEETQELLVQHSHLHYRILNHSISPLKIVAVRATSGDGLTVAVNAPKDCFSRLILAKSLAKRF